MEDMPWIAVPNRRCSCGELMELDFKQWFATAGPDGQMSKSMPFRCVGCGRVDEVDSSVGITDSSSRD